MHSELESVPNKGRTLLILLSVLVGIAGLLGCVPAMAAPMMFDAPGSEKSLLAWTLFTSVFTFPAVCAGGIVAAWLADRAGRRWLAHLLLAAPLINVVVGAGVVLWMEVFQDGQFAPP